MRFGDPTRQHLFLRCDMKIINKLICYFKGHVSLQRGQDCDSIYYLLENSGAFCQGVTSIYGGILYHCSRCGELHIIRGVLSWELEDLILDTLKDLPANYFNDIWYSWNYDFCRIYK